MKLTLAIIITFSIINGYSQKIFRIHWQDVSHSTIKLQHIKSDSVFYYPNKKHKDSSLIMTEFFDSSGCAIERDEFNFNGDIVSIVNYAYIDTVLFKEETSIKLRKVYDVVMTPDKIINTYDHDSTGKIVKEKTYQYYNDSVFATKRDRQYDEDGILIAEYVSLSNGKLYEQYNYIYENGILTRMIKRNYEDQTNNTFIFEYDKKENSKSVYILHEDEKKLQQKFYYDSKDRLIDERTYLQRPGPVIFKSDAYTYNINNLIDKQSFVDMDGLHYYFQHKYSK